MDSKIKSKWIAALRSGNYTQGRGMLRNCDNEFCCLGVLAEITAPDKWLKDSGEWLYQDNSYFLDDDFADSLGLPYGAQDELSTMNDEGESFSNLADYIEQNL